jgi:hypothetical protein
MPTDTEILNRLIDSCDHVKVTIYLPNRAAAKAPDWVRSNLWEVTTVSERRKIVRLAIASEMRSERATIHPRVEPENEPRGEERG